MSIQYSGGSLINFTFTDNGTRLNIVNNLNTQLKNAGWTALSGDGTSDVVLRSATTPAGANITFELIDPGSGNCAQIKMRNATGSKVGYIGYIFPGSVQWRIVANKYQFFLFRTGTADLNTSRTVYMGGTIYTPDNITASLGSDLEIGWSLLNGASDVGTADTWTWRSMGPEDSSTLGNDCYKCSLLLSNMVLDNGSGYGPTLPLLSGGWWGRQPTNPFRWFDNSIIELEPLIAMSSTSSDTSEYKFVGQLYDAFVAQVQVNGESLYTLPDGHTYIAITHQSASPSQGTLFVMVT